MNKKDISDRIKKVLSGNQFLIGQGLIDSIGEQTSLINDLALDSIQILELIIGLEKEFMFTCEPDELNIDIFDRFDALVTFVEKKLSAK